MTVMLSDALSMPENSSIFGAVSADMLTDYANFCERVETKIYDVMVHLENNKKSFSQLGEDALTAIVATGLAMSGLDADHDTNRNGHADLVVKQGRFEWLGEAKLENGPAYSMEGFRQLADRYTTGRPLASRGGLLLYSQKGNKVKVLKDWLAHLTDSYEAPITVGELCQLTLTQTTSHKHQHAGTDYTIRHFVVSFFENPTDKSARDRKK